MIEKINLPAINEIPEKTWQRLAEKNIYFGHQSVGNNIIDGIKKVMQSNEIIKLNIEKTNSPEAFDKPLLAHSDVGKNQDTESKINDFRKYLQKGIGDKADIAFFKFCFWDIRDKSDITQVFNSYKKTLSELKSQYPKTKFVHFTVPLMSYQDGITTRIKRLLNMKVGSDRDNIRRNELNKLILYEYKDKEPVFDIALVESTLPDGIRTSFSRNGNIYYYLASPYTHDGGHLNEEGRRLVSEQLLIFLAKLSI